MKIAMKFQGGAELAATLSKMPTRVSTTVKRDALMDGGERIRQRAASLAPREPGRPDLAANLVIGPRRSSAPGETAVGIGPNSRGFFYDWFQEFGTAKHGAQPFYRPALDTEIPSALKIIGMELWLAVESYKLNLDKR